MFQFLKNEDGVTAIEYSLIAALIAVVIIAVLTTLGGNVSSTFDSVSGAIVSGGGGPGPGGGGGGGELPH